MSQQDKPEASASKAAPKEGKPHKDSKPVTQTVTTGAEGYRAKRIAALEASLKAKKASEDTESDAELDAIAEEIKALKEAEKNANS